jgi:hypothetical protein
MDQSAKDYEKLGVFYLGREFHPDSKKTSEASVKQLKKIAADIKKESGYKTTVVVDMADRNREDLEALSRKAGIENIRFLKGGLIAYHQYLSGLAQAARPRGARIKTVGECSPCAEKRAID